MSISFEERPGSGASTKESAEYLYRASGTDSEAYVRSVALALSPPAVYIPEGTLYRDDVLIDPRGHKLFHVRVPYTRLKKSVGSYRLTFDTTGGTVHISTSRETIARYPEDAADHKQAIDVASDGEVRGADIVIPALKITVHFKHPTGYVSIGQIKSLARYTGGVNSDTFLTFAPGEVLFLGAKGSEGTDAETEVAYDFACSENATGLNIGDIADIEKQGHDLIWVGFQQKIVDEKETTRPEAVYIERIYKRIGMAAALGFGG